MSDQEQDPRSGRFTYGNVTIRISTGGPATVNLTDAQIRALGDRIKAALQAQSRYRPGRNSYPDQSIASMTPEQAGEIVESFRMEAAEKTPPPLGGGGE